MPRNHSLTVFHRAASGPGGRRVRGSGREARASGGFGLLTSLAAGTIAASLFVLAACHRNHPASEALVEEQSKALFAETIVDAAPPGGAQCCTDIAALGDLNQDGYVDVVIGAENASGAGLVWYEYPAWQRHDIAVGQFTTDAQVVDFDGDGDLDIVAGESQDGVLWFEHTDRADGWVRHTVGPGYAHDIAVADLDGDGSLDVAVADKKGVHVFYSGDAAGRETVVSRAGEGLQALDLDGDGDIDLLYSNAWIEQVAGELGQKWSLHEIDPTWNADTRIQAADVNGDGITDVILSGSEGKSPLAWFEAPGGNLKGLWIKHQIGSEKYQGVHSLRAADFDMDGDVDVLLAEMRTSSKRRVQLQLNEGGTWKELPLARHGSHNAVVGDLDADGDIDIVAKNYQGEGRFVEFWENRSADLKKVPRELQAAAADDAATPAAAGEWQYQPIDGERPKSDFHKFGLLTHDVDGDGQDDVVAGGSIYFAPPGGNGEWRRVIAAVEGDIVHVASRTSNGWPLLLAIRPESLDIIEASSSKGTNWITTPLQLLPKGRTQGYAAGVPDDAGSYDFFFSHGNSLYRLSISSQPANAWPLQALRSDVQEESVVLGDLDADGRQDLVVVAASGKQLLWLRAKDSQENAGLMAAWEVHPLGASRRWIDRVAIADFNGDGRQDLAYTEESADLAFNSRLIWLEAPADPLRQAWTPHVITTLRSINSMDVQDMNADGKPDIVVAEHTDMSLDTLASNNFTGVFLNNGGIFATQIVEIGKHSSHLGARTLALGDSGAYDIVSVGWAQGCCVHRWHRVSNNPD